MQKLLAHMSYPDAQDLQRSMKLGFKRGKGKVVLTFIPLLTGFGKRLALRLPFKLSETKGFTLLVCRLFTEGGPYLDPVSHGACGSTGPAGTGFVNEGL